ncbi:MAG: exopolyphosphatase [Pseudomonadota bacterium]
MSDATSSNQLAALDLGSNSFHLVVANYRDGHLTTVDKIKEMVRLADGLDNSGAITPAATKRALDCLQRFGQRLRHLPSENVRVVGTNTLRKASNAGHFLREATGALGHRIDVISGREEARILFMGVSHALDDEHKRRLVIDIGGGSTELIIGRRFEPKLMDSLYMGCVSLSAKFFPNGKITAKGLEGAMNRARQELEPVRSSYRKHGWDTAIGSSGTMLATQSVLAALSLSSESITPESLDELRRIVVDARDVKNLSLAGLSKDRTPVFPGGIAIISALIEELEIDQLRVSSGALREGLLLEIIGRMEHEDVRSASVDNLEQRYHVDREHSHSVASTAKSLWKQARAPWDLAHGELRRALLWAARLHEIGLDISHSQYHKHGAYLLDNMDLPGFSRLDQLRLATLVRVHRRKFTPDLLPDIEDSARLRLLRLAVLLRVSCVLHRARDRNTLPDAKLVGEDDQLTISLPKDWLAEHPLTRLDLTEEANYLQAVGVLLKITTH